jgi:hypothetical protein
LSFHFCFERSKAWAGSDGPWAVIFVLVGGFAMKMGYPVLLVPNTYSIDVMFYDVFCGVHVIYNVMFCDVFL